MLNGGGSGMGDQIMGRKGKNPCIFLICQSEKHSESQTIVRWRDKLGERGKSRASQESYRNMINEEEGNEKRKAGSKNASKTQGIKRNMEAAVKRLSSALSTRVTH